ncbi:MAG: hypothetical protein HDT47_01280 [Ruminococcaceae bacterium]|nr:hypothetical protein [Oscillospiraceae bacterium]
MILGVNFDFGASQIFDMKWSFKLYDQKTIARLIAANPQLLPLPGVNTYKNLDWYQKKLNSAITQGILHGDSIPKIAKQLDSVTNSGKAAAIRNVRTAITGAECAGRDESYRMAQEDGVELVREWIATLGNRTRHSHAAIDGEQREVGEAFSNGCMYPGDSVGVDGNKPDPSEVYNCRCTILAHVKGYEKYHERGKYGNGKLGDETYDEWKERHIAALEEEKAKKSGGGLKNNNESGIIKSSEIRETLEKSGIDYKEVQVLKESLTTPQIIEKVGGGDTTTGSCASAAFAYIGNKSGFDVTDFRGGKSTDFFSKTKNINEITQLANGVIIKNTNDFKSVNELLKLVSEGKEYLLGAGQHVAIIRKLNNRFEYLELQSATDNGFKHLTTNILKERFGCKKSHSVMGFKLESSSELIDIENFKDNKEFQKILGYINTASENQMKGIGGKIK